MNEPNHHDLARFAELDAKPMVPRIAGYLKFMGPGYLQSAMTLGGGSAFAALFSGLDVADFGDQVAVLIDNVVPAFGEGAAVAGQGEEPLEC